MKARILILFCALGLLLEFVPSALAVQTYTDDFEDDTNLTTPSASWYTASGVSGIGAFFVQTTRSLGSKAVEVNRAGTDFVSRFLFDTSGANLCTSGSLVGFAFNIDTSPSTNAVIKFALRSSSTANLALLSITNLQAQIGSDTGNANSNIGSALSLDTWYNASISVNTCATPRTVQVCIDGVGCGTHTGAGTAATTLDRLHIEIANQDAQIFFDDFSIINVNDPPPTSVGASATATVTDLVGFDVDPTGSGLIARTDSGDFIRSYAPKSLSQIGSRDTNCVDPDMVSSSDIANVYVVCDAGDPEFFSIRNFDESVFDFPGNCSPSDDCLDDIDFESDCSFEDENFLGQIEDLVPIPLDYSYLVQNPLIGDSSRAFAVAYTAQNGYVGVFEYTTKDGTDGCNEERVSFAGSVPEQMCVWQVDPEGQSVQIGAVDSAGATKIYDYVPAIVRNQQLGNDELDGTLTLRTTLTPTGGVGISCTANHVLLVTNAASSNLHYVNIDSGQDESGFPKTVTNEANRGVHLTGNDEFYGYVEGANVILGWTGNASTFGSFAIPTGTFFEVLSNSGGQDWWIATTARIAYFDAFTAFPSTIGSGCIPDCTPDEGAGDTGFFTIPTGSGTPFPNSTLAGLFFGAVMMGMVATGSYFTFNRSILGALIGLLLGFMVSWAMGLFTTAVVTTIAILAVIIFGARYWIGRNAQG